MTSTTNQTRTPPLKTVIEETNHPQEYRICVREYGPLAKPYYIGRLTRTGKHRWQHSLSPTSFSTRQQAINELIDSSRNIHRINTQR